jgi:hypothetical protein
MGRKAKRGNDKYGAATVVLMLLLVAAFIYAFQALGIYGMLFKPEPAATQSAASYVPATSPVASAIPSAIVSVDPDATPGDSTQATAPVDTSKQSDVIKMTSVTLYGVQLGVYTQLENAQATADKFKAQGSAGYILKEDTLYRVIDSVYYSENDAKTVRDAFRAGSSPDACVIRVQASGVNWQVNNATQDQISAIRGALSAVQSQIVVLINAQKATQQNQGTADDWKTTIGTAAQKFTDASGVLMNAVGSTNADVILKLNDCLTASAGNFTKLTKMDSTDVLAIESGLKYDIIDMLLNLQKQVMG